MKRDINRFNTSDYAIDNAYSILLANKNVPNLIKVENDGAIMTEFIGLRTKLYNLCIDGKKVEGVKNNVVAKSITFDNYVCLFDETEIAKAIMHKIKNIRCVHDPKQKSL